MRKLIRNIKYGLDFRKTANNLRKIIEATFITEFKITNPKIKVNFRFGYAQYFYRPSVWFGTRQIGIIREDYQDSGWVSSFYTIKQYLELKKKLVSTNI